LLKKITIVGTTVMTIIIIIGLAISTSSTEENFEESELIMQADVIMPTKVSRPGCEEIDRCYIPSLIVIESGKQVTWVNEDSAFHSVTSGFYDAPTELFDSGHLDPFESYTLTFDETGTYDYFCTLHPWMEGQVIVE
jgi:plastocyanin